jgi:hypothetical protein
MNAVPSKSSEIDWVINYIEINSRPISSDEFCRLRLTDGEIKIDPAGIVLSIGNKTNQGLTLKSATGNYLGQITQRGNELVVKLKRVSEPGNVMIVAKKSVCAFETRIPTSPSGTFKIHMDADQIV